MNKERLRTQIRVGLSTLNSVERERQSLLIQRKLHSQLSTLNPKAICLYLPTSTEPTLNIANLYTITSFLYCPKYCNNAYNFVAFNPKTPLQTGPYSIKEPVATDIISSEYLQHSDTVFLVPGLAFTSKGDRLGHGKGIYDQLLADVPGTKIGLCFDLQLVDPWDCEKHDVRMDVVISV